MLTESLPESPSPEEKQEDPAAVPAGPDKAPQNARPKTASEARGARSGAGGEASNAKPGPEPETRGATPEKAANEGWAPGAARTGGPAFAGSVSAIGDSVMLGAVGSLQKDIKGLAVVDAEVGMQVYTAIDILRAAPRANSARSWSFTSATTAPSQPSSSTR